MGNKKFGFATWLPAIWFGIKTTDWVRFDSKTEARWALFLLLCGAKFELQKPNFSHIYRADFLIFEADFFGAKKQNFIIEVKGAADVNDVEKILYAQSQGYFVLNFGSFPNIKISKSPVITTKRFLGGLLFNGSYNPNDARHLCCEYARTPQGFFIHNADAICGNGKICLPFSKGLCGFYGLGLGFWDKEFYLNKNNFKNADYVLKNNFEATAYAVAKVIQIIPFYEKSENGAEFGCVLTDKVPPQNFDFYQNLLLKYFWMDKNKEYSNEPMPNYFELIKTANFGINLRQKDFEVLPF